MSDGRAIGPGGTIAIALLIVGVAFVAVRPGSQTIVYDDTPPVDPPADGRGVVASLRSEGGFSIFGLQVTSPSRVVEVRFVTGPDCVDLLTPGEPWPTTRPECDSVAEVSGEVGGLGRTPDGRSLVGVDLAVSRACFSRLTIGMPWPPEVAECVP